MADKRRFKLWIKVKGEDTPVFIDGEDEGVIVAQVIEYKNIAEGKPEWTLKRDLTDRARALLEKHVEFGFEEIRHDGKT